MIFTIKSGGINNNVFIARTIVNKIKMAIYLVHSTNLQVNVNFPTAHHIKTCFITSFC